MRSSCGKLDRWRTRESKGKPFALRHSGTKLFSQEKFVYITNLFILPLAFMDIFDQDFCFLLLCFHDSCCFVCSGIILMVIVDGFK